MIVIPPFSSALRGPLLSGFRCTATHSNCLSLLIIRHDRICVSLICLLRVNATILCAWYLLVEWSDQALMVKMSAEPFVATLDTLRVIVPRIRHRAYPLRIISPWHLVQLKITVPHVDLLGKRNHAEGERALSYFRVRIDKDVIVWPIFLEICIFHGSWYLSETRRLTKGLTDL